MTIRIKSKYKICRNYRVDIWAKSLITKKITKFATSLVPIKKRAVSLGNFTGVMEKPRRIYKKRRTRYGKNLVTKQKLLRFYGRIKEYQFKKYLAYNKKFKANVLENALKMIEQRLDVLLHRSHLVKNIFDSRMYILHKNVVVNNKTINKPSYIVKPGEIVSTKLPFRVWKGLKRTPFVWGYSSNHLHVNWKTMKVTLHSKPVINRTTYPFKIHKKRILNFYKV